VGVYIENYLIISLFKEKKIQ